MPDDISNLLNSRKNKQIMIKLRSDKVLTGTLKDFDVHMTLRLDNAVDVSDNRKDLGSVLLRGDNILIISIPEDEPQK